MEKISKKNIEALIEALVTSKERGETDVTIYVNSGDFTILTDKNNSVIWTNERQW